MRSAPAPVDRTRRLLDRLGRLAVRFVPALVRRKLVWWFVVCTQPRFFVGVCSVLRSADGRLLLLEHRFWEDGKWGVPSGHLAPFETPERTAARELREECGLVPRDLRVVHVQSGFENRVEVWLTGALDITQAPAPEALDAREITRAALLPVPDALERMRPGQREIVTRILKRPESATGSELSSQGI